ncbi:TPA: ATP-grasp domain-containing protein [Salmonella enterica]|uniref:ATP-grasp domain-containing protein n=1 Tax=Salmonella enterica TaxID=28901 RepID=A0A756LAZ2_SALER|nr:ATP-grasp domain-containing protein [Salmonella enterica]
MKKYIVVVEASFLGVEYVAKAIRKIGYEPVFLTNYRSQEGDALVQLATERAIFCETTETKDIISVIDLLGRSNIVGVTTFLDSRLSIIASVNKLLGLPGVSESLLKLKDKSYVNGIIPEFVPKSLAVEWGKTPKDKIEDFLLNSDANKYIAKPSFTAGAIGTFVFKKYEELSNGIDSSVDKIPKHLEPNKYVVQEFFDGNLVSIEGYTYKDRIEFIGATLRYKFDNTEVKHKFPYQDDMGMQNYEKCKSIICKLINRSNYEYGFFHVEFMVSDNEVRLIDANMGRPGGTNIMELISFSYEIDPVLMFEHAISIAVFQKPTIDSQFFIDTPCVEMTGVLYGQKETARLLRFESPTLKSTHHLAVNMGTTVPKLGESNWSVIGTLTGRPNDVFTDLKNIKLITDKGVCSAVISE